MSERDEQITFFSYIQVLQNQNPDLAEDLHWVHASMNGAWFNTPHMAATAKKEGLTPGILDIFWAYRTEEYPGLYIEMKFGKNKPTDTQAAYIEWVQRQGYLTRICYDWTEAIKVLCEYAGIDIPDFQ